MARIKAGDVVKSIIDISEIHDMDQLYGSDSYSLASVIVSVNGAAHSWLADYYADIEREVDAMEELLVAHRRERNASWAWWVNRPPVNYLEDL